jgi:hypothetical protein
VLLWSWLCRLTLHLVCTAGRLYCCISAPAAAGRYYTPEWLAALEPSGLFGIFAVFGVICYVFVLVYIPETKGIALEEMDELFANFRGGGGGAGKSTKGTSVGKPSDFMMAPPAAATAAAASGSGGGGGGLGDGLLS